ncbi:MAG: transporter substrate-binding protein [Verrucomicrobia bacterium]|nr:transporter substrate-binding protein [Verrucomicrobiota bacterium]
MTRRRRSILLAVALLVAAYGLSLTQVLRRGSASNRDEPSPVVIRFVHWQLESGMREAFDLVARRYMALHPGVRVEQFAVPSSIYHQWLSTQLAGNDVPDLVSFNSTDQAKVAQLPRYFQAITRWVDEPNPYNAGTKLAGVPWRLTFLDGGKNRSTYIDQYRNYYAVGLSTHSMRIFYNRALLREITGGDEPPRDFRSWLELGKKVRAFRPGLVHVAGARENAIWLMPTLLNLSLGRWILEHDHELRFSATSFDLFGDLLDGEWTLRSAPMQDALRIMRAFGGEMSPGFLQLDRDSAMRAFLRGEAFSLPNGTWDYPTMRAQAGFEIGAFRLPLPEMDDPDFGGYVLRPMSDGGISTAMPFYLTRQGRHPEVAIDFLRYVTSLEGNRLFSQASHWMPSVEGVEIEPELRPFKQMNSGYVVTDAQNGPLLMNGPGEEYTQLFEKNLHTLYAPNGGVEAYNHILEPELLAAAEAGLRKQVRVQRENLRRRDVALAAQHFLDAAEQAESIRQQSGLHLNEIQIYLMAEKLVRKAR